MGDCYSSLNRKFRSYGSQTQPLGKLSQDRWEVVARLVNLRRETAEPWSNEIQLRKYENWYHLQLFAAKYQVAHGFMSEEQWNSYRLLFDFWTAELQNPSIPVAYLLSYLEKFPNIMDDNYRWRLVLGKHMEVLQVSELQPYHVEGLSEDSYSPALWDLFLAEFCHPKTYAAETDFDLGFILRARRYDAAVVAYCQNAAMQCLRDVMPDLFRPALKPMQPLSDETVVQNHVCSLEASDPGRPRRVDLGPLITACPWLPKRKFRLYEDSEDEDDDDRDDDLEREPLAGWPEYLWDLEKSRTIPTRTLGYNRPAYTAISHTWGRGARSETAYIHGGLKSPVPLNTTFDVTAIPESLSALKGQLNTRYVWLDLVCVPQSCDCELSKEHEQIRLQEIGREDLIFRNAATSVAWLHDVEDLSCLAALFQWLSLSMVELDDDTESTHWRERLKDGLLERIKDRRTGLLGSEGTAELERSNSWFTSLWTFQELCLRPDMLLATSNLKIMSLDNGQHIPLNGVVCVYNRYVSSSKPPEEISVAMKDMSDWCQYTGLGQLLDLTQVDVLKLAKRRYCKEGRAEAIMSVLGATVWFEDVQAGRFSVRQETQTQYPSEFVKEVRNRIPDVVFTTPMKLSGVEDNERSKEAQKILKEDRGETFAMYYYDSAQLQEVLESALE